jgi:hypothetical protein
MKPHLRERDGKIVDRGSEVLEELTKQKNLWR